MIIEFRKSNSSMSMSQSQQCGISHTATEVWQNSNTAFECEKMLFPRLFVVQKQQPTNVGNQTSFLNACCYAPHHTVGAVILLSV